MELEANSTSQMRATKERTRAGKWQPVQNPAFYQLSFGRLTAQVRYRKAQTVARAKVTRKKKNHQSGNPSTH
jgi:hypothetical protein